MTDITPAAPERCGPYRLEAELGRGLDGVVYRARHADTGARVAVKTVRLPRAEMAASLRREVAALRALDHPGVVRVLDAGGAGRDRWLALQFIDGAPLDAHVRTFWPDELSRLLTCVARLCDTLAWLHARGYVHRDLKPANILVGADDRPVLVDFGLVSRVGAVEARADVAGTRAYMAPEQLEGRAVDARADLYAVGVLLHTLIAGAAPFADAAQALDPEVNPPRLDEAPAGAPPFAPTSAAQGDDVPPAPTELADLVIRLLAADPAERPGYAADVAAALRRLGAADAAPPPPPPYLYRPALVGRRDALRGVLGFVSRRLGAGAGAVVALSGEPGIGKTRLASEVAQRLERAGLPVFATSAGGGPLAPFVRWLRARLDEAPIELGPLAPFLTDAVEPDVGDVELARRRYFAALEAQLRAACQQGPRVFVVDDVQAADPLTRAAFDALRAGDLFQTGRLALLLTGPPEAFADLAGDAAHVETLERLGPGTVVHLAADMLAIPASERSAPLLATLSTACGGNPLFAAEYLRGAVSARLLDRDDQGRWRLVDPDAASLPLPDAVRDLAARRVRELPDIARALAAAAAAWGEGCTVEALEHSFDRSAQDFATGLQTLLLRQVLEAEDDRLRFVHAQIRDAAGATLSEDERAPLHARIADLLGEADPIDHARRAHHHVLAGQRAQARADYREAARRALGRYALDEAERVLRALLELIDDAAERAEALNRLGAEVLRVQGRGDEAVALHLEAAELGDAGARSDALRGAASARLDQGRVEEAESYIDAGMQAVQAGTRTAAELLRLRGVVALMRGQPAAAVEPLEAAVAALRSSPPDRGAEGRMLGLLAIAAHDQGRRGAAEATYRAALDAHRAAGDRLWEGVTLSNLAGLLSDGDGLDEAAEMFDQALAINREVGDRRSEAITLSNLARVACWAGRLEDAQRHADASLAMARETEDRRHEGIALEVSADIARGRGALEAAVALYARAHALGLEADNATHAFAAACGQVATLRALGRPVDLDAAAELAAALDSPEHTLWFDIVSVDTPTAAQRADWQRRADALDLGAHTGPRRALRALG